MRIPTVQLSLAVGLLIIGVAISFLLVNLSSSGAEIREESAEMLALSDMESALLATNVWAAGHVESLAAGGAEAASHTYGSHSELDSEIAAFDSAFTRLSALTQDEALDVIQSRRDGYVGSLERLHNAAHLDGGGAFAVYHDEVEVELARLQTAIVSFQIVEGEHLQEAIAESEAVDRWLLWLMPLLLLLAFALAVSLMWVERRRRLQETFELRRQNSLKDEFIASVSHELRTPLTSVVGFLDVLRGGADDLPTDERDELVTIAAQEARDLSDLVEDLLVLAKADAGRLSIAGRDVSLRTEVEQVLDSLSLVESVPVQGAAPIVAGDSVRIRQILRNLITNAVRYGGPSVRIEMAADSRIGSVRVVDDGPGVPEGEGERIFEPYHRAHSFEGVTGAVGLGLSVSRRLAVMMGGSLEYHRSGSETVFELTLPLLPLPSPRPEGVRSSATST